MDAETDAPKWQLRHRSEENNNAGRERAEAPMLKA
jgi:hypothetical protein